MSAEDAAPAGAPSPTAAESLSPVSGNFSLVGTAPLLELAQDAEAVHYCCSCKEPLRQPPPGSHPSAISQPPAPCGHRICAPCLAKLKDAFGANEFHCPACETITATPDVSAARFYCRNKQHGCSKEFLWQSLQDHIKNGCSFDVLPCPNSCGAGGLPSSQMEEHLRHCPLGQLKKCLFQPSGCKFVGTGAELQRHKDESVATHLEMLMETLALWRQQQDLQRVEEAVQRTEAFLQRSEEAVQRTEEAVRHTEESLQRTEASLQRSEDALQRTEAAVRHTEETRTENGVHELEEQVGRVQTELTALKDSSQARPALPEDIRKLLIKHDKTLGAHDKTLGALLLDGGGSTEYENAPAEELRTTCRHANRRRWSPPI